MAYFWLELKTFKTYDSSYGWSTFMPVGADKPRQMRPKKSVVSLRQITGHLVDGLKWTGQNLGHFWSILGPFYDRHLPDL